MYFVFVKDISAKQLVSCTHLHKALRFPASEQAWVTTYQSKTTVDVGLTFKQGHCRPLDQSGNKQTNKLYNPYYWVWTMHQFTLIVGFLVENPLYHPEKDNTQMLVEKHYKLQ